MAKKCGLKMRAIYDKELWAIKIARNMQAKISVPVLNINCTVYSQNF